jgi:hypothetical protein
MADSALGAKYNMAFNRALAASAEQLTFIASLLVQQQLLLLSQAALQACAAMLTFCCCVSLHTLPLVLFCAGLGKLWVCAARLRWRCCTPLFHTAFHGEEICLLGRGFRVRF